MKRFRVRFTLKSHISVMETVINANNAADAKHMMQSQYGADLRSIATISEIR